MDRSSEQKVLGPWTQKSHGDCLECGKEQQRSSQLPKQEASLPSFSEQRKRQVESTCKGEKDIRVQPKIPSIWQRNRDHLVQPKPRVLVEHEIETMRRVLMKHVEFEIREIESKFDSHIFDDYPIGDVRQLEELLDNSHKQTRFLRLKTLSVKSIKLQSFLRKVGVLRFI